MLCTLLVGITACILQRCDADSAVGFLSPKPRSLQDNLNQVASDLNAAIEGGDVSTCDDASFTGCGIIIRTVDWESNNVLFYRASAHPRQEGYDSVWWLQDKVSTQIANKANLPQAFDEPIIGNMGMVYNPQANGATPVCGYGMDGWVDRSIRQGAYDDGNGMSWTDGIDGCGACHSDTSDDDPRCRALQWDYMSSIDGWIAGVGGAGACPNPDDPQVGEQATGCSVDTFNPGLGKSYMPPSWAKLPWKDILTSQMEKQQADDHTTFQWAQSGYAEILLSLAGLEADPWGISAFWVDASAKLMGTWEQKRMVQIAMDQCITFNRAHPEKVTPLLWIDFNANSGNFFSLASDCTTARAGSSEWGGRFIIESAQQVGKGHEPLADHEEKAWELDSHGELRRMCLDLPHGDLVRSPQLWGCDGLAQQNWVYSIETHTISSEVDEAKCLKTENGGLVMHDCDPSDASQLWWMPTSGVGQIKSIKDGVEYCVDTQGGVTWAFPSWLSLEVCNEDPANNKPSQLWAIHCRDADGVEVPCGELDNLV